MAGNVVAQRKYLYGITHIQYKALLEAQQGKCAVCGNGETMLGRGGNTRSLSVDHCHKTGAIRGLLCDSCNNILGRAKDSPALLRKLAAYLEEANTGIQLKYIDAEKALAELCLTELEGATPCPAA